jgi:thioredoxin-dependent peroxiredoxin
MLEFRWRFRVLPLVALCVMMGCKEESSDISSLPERTGVIQRKGMPMTLLGPELKVGQRAPEFTVLDMDMKERKLGEFKGKFVVISSIPSVDTPMCNLQTLRLNEEAEKLKPEVAVLTISWDLPFAQKRWCDDKSVSHTLALSDYRDRNFGKAYGLIIKERMLLARAVIIIDPEGIIRYLRIVKEQFSQPDYGDLLNALNKLREDT